VQDTARLESCFARGDLLHPLAGLPGFMDMACAVAALAGVSVPAAGPFTAQVCSRIGQAQRCVFVLVDGMGIRQLEENLPADSFLQRHLEMELRAAFLSTTAAALTSLATCRWPAEHAVPAWFTFVEKLGHGVLPLPFVEQGTKTPLPKLGITPGDVFPLPPVWGQSRRRLVSLMPAGICDSVYTRYSSGGTPRTGYTNLNDAFTQLVSLALAADEADFVYCYLPQLDEMAHEKGNGDPGVRRLMGTLNAKIESLAGRLPRDTRLIVGADHGQADVPPDGRRIILPEDDPLAAMLVCKPTGEPCVPIFHVRRGQEEAFSAMFSSRFGDVFALVAPDEAGKLRLFGPMPLSPVMKQRLGTFMGICLQPAKFHVLPLPDSHVNIGVHGSLSPAEMRIPLIVA